MKANMAETYGVANVEEKFTATPALEQKLQDKIVEQDTFLQKINVITVGEMAGENILGSMAGPVSSRTDTSAAGERIPRDLLSLTPAGYQLSQTNSDVYIRYTTMDSWARLGDLGERYSKYLQGRIANDRTMIGWYGESAAATTDPVANPMLQDVNVGWLEYMRTKLPANVMTEVVAASGVVKIGPNGDYKNLDHAVADLLTGIPQYLRSDLVVLVGSELLGNESSALFAAIGDKPTEKTVAAAALNNFGGLPAESPNNFPPRGIVITSYDNLSIYVQEGTWRRNLKDKPEKDRTEDFNSRNEGYTVESPEKFVAIDFKNVQVPDGAGGWA